MAMRHQTGFQSSTSASDPAAHPEMLTSMRDNGIVMVRLLGLLLVVLAIRTIGTADEPAAANVDAMLLAVGGAIALLTGALLDRFRGTSRTPAAMPPPAPVRLRLSRFASDVKRVAPAGHPAPRIRRDASRRGETDPERRSTRRRASSATGEPS